MDTRYRRRRRPIRKRVYTSRRRTRRSRYPLYKRVYGNSLQTFTTSYSLKGIEAGSLFAVAYSYGATQPRRAYTFGWLLDPELVVVLNNARDTVLYPAYSSDPWFSKLASLGQFKFAGLHMSLGVLPGKVVVGNDVTPQLGGTWTLDICYIPNYRGIWSSGGYNANTVLFGSQNAINSSLNHRRFTQNQQAVPMRWGLATPRSFLDPSHSAATSSWKQLKYNAEVTQTIDDATQITKVYDTYWGDILSNLSTGAVFIRLDWVTDVLSSQIEGKTFDPPDLELGVSVNYRSNGPLKPEIVTYVAPTVMAKYRNVEFLPGSSVEEAPELINPLTKMTI